MVRFRTFRTSSVVGVLALVSSSGCNAIVGIREPLDEKSTPGTPGTPDTSAFIGRWTSTGKQHYERCTSPEDAYSEDASELVVAAGTTSTLTFTFAGCMVEASVEGDTATVRPNQSCNFGSLVIAYYPNASFTLKSDGTASLRSTGKATFPESPGYSCEFRSENVYTKAAATGGGA